MSHWDSDLDHHDWLGGPYPRVEWRTCGDCRESFPMVVEGDYEPFVRCRECERLDKERARVQKEQFDHALPDVRRG